MVDLSYLKTFIKSITAKMNIKLINRTINIMAILIIITCHLALPVQVYSTELTRENSIQEKLAKNYSNKFCNAIGIGLSKESALKITIQENSDIKYNPTLWLRLALNSDQNLNDINQDQLINTVSSRIIDDCGFAINIQDEESKIKFKDDFSEIYNNYQKSS